MKKNNTKRRLPVFFRWVLWVLMVQFLLINISASIYAYKFTHPVEGKPSPSEINYPTNFFVKAWLLFLGPRQYKSASKNIPPFSYTDVTLLTKENIPIKAWYGAVDSVSRGTVILFHGYTQNKSTVIKEANSFHEWGYNVMLVDDRGNGDSGGRTTTIGYKEAEEVKLAYDYIKEKDNEPIYFCGLSMGAVQILKSVSENDLKPAGIILEAPFGSLQDHLKGRARSLGFPEQPFAALTTFWIGLENGFNGFGFNCNNYAKKINCPVLLQYGAKDQLVKRKEIETIYSNIPSTNKKLVIYVEAYHEDLLRIDPALWNRELRNFLTENQ